METQNMGEMMATERLAKKLAEEIDMDEFKQGIFDMCMWRCGVAGMSKEDALKLTNEVMYGKTEDNDLA